MESKMFHEIIIEDAMNEVSKINSDTDNLVQEVRSNGVNIIKEEYRKIIADKKSEAANLILAYKHKTVQKLYSYEQESKNKIVEEIFDEIYQKIRSFEEIELCNWMYKLIKNVKVTGKEKIVVPKNKKEKYLRALSSDLKDSNIDLINSKESNYEFSIDSDNLYFNDGFILVGEYYDLIFDYKEIVDKYRKEYGKKVYEKLFENK